MRNILPNLDKEVHIPHWRLLTVILLLGAISLFGFSLWYATTPEKIAERHTVQEQLTSDPQTYITRASHSPETAVATQQVAEKLDLERKVIATDNPASVERIAQLAREHNAEVIEQQNNTLVVKVPKETETELFEEISQTGTSASYETDYPVYLASTPDWGVEKIEAPEVWDTTGAGGIRVGVVDTGIDYSHPELSGRYVGGYDFYNNDTDPVDDHGHGTHVAGIIAATANGTGTIGVSPEAGIYALKVLDADGTGYISDIVEAIDWAIDNNVQILNFSLGTTYDSDILEQKLSQAQQAGILLVGAAGNTNGGSLLYPAGYNSVIAVSATDSNDNFASFSSIGAEVAAPGVSVTSSVPGGGYASWSGTSMAAPHVSATAALMLANEQPNVREQLRDTAIDVGADGVDPYYGYGRVSARSAVLGEDVLDPIVSVLSPEHESEVAEMVAVRASVQDESEIEQVELRINDDLVETWTEAPYEYIWDTTTYPLGEYQLVVSAIDEFENEGSAQVTVQLVDEVTSSPSPTLSPTPDQGQSGPVRQDTIQEPAEENRQDRQHVPENSQGPQPPPVTNRSQRNPKPAETSSNEDTKIQSQSNQNETAPSERGSERGRERANSARGGNVRGVQDEQTRLEFLWQQLKQYFPFN